MMFYGCKCIEIKGVLITFALLMSPSACQENWMTHPSSYEDTQLLDRSRENERMPQDLVEGCLGQTQACRDPVPG